MYDCEWDDETGGYLLDEKSSGHFYRGQFVAETQGGDLFDLPVLKNVVHDLFLSLVALHGMCCKNENLLNGQIRRKLKDIYADLSWHTARASFAAFDSWKFMEPYARKFL